MTKPKMLHMGQWGWSATSPLVYTLQRNAKYAHFGYTKYFAYLELAFNGYQRNPVKEIYNRVVSGTWENWKSTEAPSHNLNTTQDLEPLRDFPLEHFTKLVTGIPTISKYVDFYSALYDHVSTKGYKSVGDAFSHPNVTSEYIQRFYDTVISEFDVKVLFIARDPVRHAFSKYLAERQRNEDNNYHSTSLPYKLNITDYIRKIKIYNQRYGEENVHVIVMEELWEDDGTAKKKLSDFLDHPITNLWKNLYAPDRGHLVEYDPDVPCQAYGQNLQVLTDDIYYHYKNKHQHIYDAWENHYGSLPLHWGMPLNYK